MYGLEQWFSTFYTLSPVETFFQIFGPATWQPRGMQDLQKNYYFLSLICPQITMFNYSIQIVLLNFGIQII